MSTLKPLAFVLAVSAFAVAGATSGPTTVFAQAGGTANPSAGSGNAPANPAAQNRNAGASGGQSGPTGGAPVGTSGSGTPSAPGASGSMGAVPAQCASISDSLARQQCIDRSRVK